MRIEGINKICKKKKYFAEKSPIYNEDYFRFTFKKINKKINCTVHHHNSMKEIA